MANRRMFSKDIVDSDIFMDMPLTSQCLYFHLGMAADDEGFIMPRRILRLVSATDDDLRVLIAKKFVIPFESGVIVIRHWRANNLIRIDRYTPTIFVDEFDKLYFDRNEYYTLEQKGNTKCLPMVNQRLTQYSLVKLSKVKGSRGKRRTEEERRKKQTMR